MASVNEKRPHCLNPMGKTHSEPLAARHGRGTAWARHAMCETALTRPLSEITRCVCVLCTVSTASGESCTEQTAQKSGTFRQRTHNTTFRLVRLANKLFWQIPSNDIFRYWLRFSCSWYPTGKNNDLSVPRKPGRHHTFGNIDIFCCSDNSYVYSIYSYSQHSWK